MIKKIVLIVSTVIFVVVGLLLCMAYGLFSSSEREPLLLDVRIPAEWRMEVSLGDESPTIIDGDGLMYLIKSFSGRIPLVMTPTAQGTRVEVGEAQSVHLDHLGASVRRISYQLESLPPLLWESERGEQVENPCFKLGVRVHLMDHLIIPLTIHYEWHFMYDVERQLLGQLNRGAGFATSEDYRNLPIASTQNRHDYKSPMYSFRKTVTRYVDAQSKVMGSAPATIAPAVLQVEGGRCYQDGDHAASHHRLVVDYRDHLLEKKDPLAVLRERSKASEDRSLIESFETTRWHHCDFRYCQLRGTPEKLWTLAWQRMDAPTDTPLARYEVTQDAYRYYLIAPQGDEQQAQLTRLPLIDISYNKYNPESRPVVSKLGWCDAPASYKGVKRIYLQTLVDEKDENRDKQTLHIITAYEDEQGQYYRLIWVPREGQ